MKEALSIVRKNVLCAISKSLCNNIAHNAVVLEADDIKSLCPTCIQLCQAYGCTKQALACSQALKALDRSEAEFLKLCGQSRMACRKTEPQVQPV